MGILGVAFLDAAKNTIMQAAEPAVAPNGHAEYVGEGFIRKMGGLG